MGMRVKFLMRLFANILKNQKRMRNSQLELLAPPPHSVLFLGDSITEQGMWHEWFPSQRVVNRGVSGERTDELLTRLATSCNSPSLVVLLIGTNDLSHGTPEAEIVHNLDRIVVELSERAPDATVIVQSVMPRARKYRDRVRSLNARFREVAASHEVIYLDLWPELASNEGTLKDGFSLDDLHLTGSGYAAWIGALRPLVEQPRLVNQIPRP